MRMRIVVLDEWNNWLAIFVGSLILMAPCLMLWPRRFVNGDRGGAVIKRREKLGPNCILYWHHCRGNMADLFQLLFGT